ncbi:HD-GYP domain-containing protein [Evansella cellulosilytica]|uniref:Metal dependent phosphohydrolase n=1 Tax=Evansella cellulosilytica (strain ATCC 21833 / DSM 2522 / FERM P-1141 / JCM 9156 / N-4) TaxID=649639 RepID=E6TVZ3_EVAC2|nr:HD-GYP domain-containing protein [Evansella cellulosilytica]ADU29816.1 metal dependent phosphohydrolase [Evansella cellulosilytica DSM 2522]
MAVIQLNDYNSAIIGKVLANDVISDSGSFLLSKGMEITDSHVEILRKHEVEYIILEDNLPPIDIQLKHIFKNEKLSSLYYDNLVEVKYLFLQAVSDRIPTLRTFMKPFTPLLDKIIHGKSVFLELHHIKGFDDYLYRHSLNVGMLAATIGKILHCKDETIVLLAQTGLLHDIGKMKIPSEILNKEGKLTTLEYNEVKKHTIYGKEMLEKISGTNEKLHLGALLHHERLDGSGYPFGMKDKIPLVAQIISVADMYDAITSDRVYRNKYSPIEALTELVNEVYKGKLNGEIVFPFVEFIMKSYVGNKVLLSDGNYGKIIRLSIEELNRPLIELQDGTGYINLREKRNVTIENVFPQ